MNSRPKIRVLVVDDSAVVRRTITGLLNQEPDIEVLAAAVDPYDARDKILELRPDVITLDLEMPRMDGITFLEHLMCKHPMPVIVLSSLTQKGSRAALAALERGAVEVLAKPKVAFELGETGRILADTVRMAASARVSARSLPSRQGRTQTGAAYSQLSWNPEQVGFIGASTGGTEAIRLVLEQLPANIPPLCLVQHMPAFISTTFVQRLDQCCAMEVREARNGDRLRPGLALVAPGDWHMALCEDRHGFFIRLRQSPKIWYQRPSVDVLFRSAASLSRGQFTAAVLTGMGRDGAEGLRELRQKGAVTFAQDEATSVVYGMPKMALECGGTDRALPLHGIAPAMLDSFVAQLSKPTLR
ncbi:chemotaxis response regulator protein-glutamate methylesterase [Ruficoccus amylovorans]|uniref:Protein-glutamate methylesterase/protein-glutamine glutaminase n=1 Tax=Ruficoccus amylovorans TaxID=1804625 RepID=A0A842HH98_9BACT|nr:chemotaxis response regulator protein-glutamate methylesterase [Ruficoccus amylovorans]MBC2594996.1 chemotaxis response regulator protein-glutamate methylesterase [Ruficoccus amylovorans]